VSSNQPSSRTPTLSQSSPPAAVTPLQSVLSELSINRRVANPIGMLGANLQTALGALWGNRLRSFLTALGIFIGVAAVVAILTLVQGAGAYISNLIGNAANNISISPTSSRGGISFGGGGGTSFRSTLTPRDFQSLVSLPHIAYATPIIRTDDQVVYGNQNENTTIQGVNSDTLLINNVKIEMGDWFTDADATNKMSVAVIGDTTYHNLFDASGDDPIGKRIRIRDQLFLIVGVLQNQGFGQDDVVYIPIQTMQVRLNEAQNYDSIQVQVDNPNNVDSTMAAIISVLRKNHNLSSRAVNDFQTFNFGQIIQRIENFLTIEAALFIGIAAISLTVGGIGIMNIMLVSVTERTWEIGIRMAVGARRGDIRNQFLIEAVVLCVAGGIIGLLLGLLIGWFLAKVSQFPFVITSITLIVPLAVSVAIALIFGIYPAVRASRLDPIAAIATE
jgi:putative ABC transport system permease protein